MILRRSSIPLAAGLLALTGCQAQTLEDPACTQDLAEVTAQDSALGFSAQQLEGFLGERLPTSILWDESTLGQSGASLSMEMLGLTGAVRIATPTGDADLCNTADATLVASFETRITLSDGAVVASGPLTVEAASLDEGEIWVRPDKALRATLHGGYLSDFEAFLAAEHEGLELDFVYFSPISTWADAQVDIAYHGTGEELSVDGMAWRGHWLRE